MGNNAHLVFRDLEERFMKTIKLTAIAALVFASSAAFAGQAIDGTKTLLNTLTHPGAVSAEVGSLGYGANVSFGANKSTEIQAGWTGGNITDLTGKIKVHGIKYKVKTDMSNPYVGVQVRPFSNWLTLGTGIIVPDNDITATAQPGSDGVYKIDGQEYKQNDLGILQAKIKHRNKLAPYATVGFHPNINNKWGVFGEVGAAYLGESKASVTSSLATADKGVLEKAAKEIENKDYAEWMPVAKVGVTYRF